MRGRAEHDDGPAVQRAVSVHAGAGRGDVQPVIDHPDFFCHGDDSCR